STYVEATFFVAMPSTASNNFSFVSKLITLLSSVFWTSVSMNWSVKAIICSWDNVCSSFEISVFVVLWFNTSFTSAADALCSSSVYISKKHSDKIAAHKIHFTFFPSLSFRISVSPLGCMYKHVIYTIFLNQWNLNFYIKIKAHEAGFLIFISYALFILK